MDKKNTSKHSKNPYGSKNKQHEKKNKPHEKKSKLPDLKTKRPPPSKPQFDPANPASGLAKGKSDAPAKADKENEPVARVVKPEPAVAKPETAVAKPEPAVAKNNPTPSEVVAQPYNPASNELTPAPQHQPMQVHADIEKTPIQPATQPGGLTSGGDIIIRLNQVELNDRLSEVGEQTQRANDISTQIAAAFNAMSDQYESGWETSRGEAEDLQKSFAALGDRIAEQDKAMSDRLGKHEKSLLQFSEKMEQQVASQLQSVSGSISGLDEVNSRQQKALIWLVLLSVILSAASIALHFIEL
jgi:hypothetical protein